MTFQRWIITTCIGCMLGITGCATTADGLAAYSKGDYAQAIKILKPLAEKEDADAQNNLGVMYDIGHGVTQGYQEALKWHRLAAARGNVNAQLILGLMYYEGKGVTRDFVRAHMWFNLSAASGNADGIRWRDIVTEMMTSQQIIETQKMARDCQQRNFKECN